MLRKAIFAILAFISLLSPTSAQFAIFQAANTTPIGFGGGPNLRQMDAFGASPVTVSPTQYYVPGACGGPCSTADYWLMNGVYGVKPSDLMAPACGVAGAAIAASKGRYVWTIGPDHYSQTTDWDDGDDIYIGFSNDPGVFPTLMVPGARWDSTVASSPGATFTGSISNGSSFLTVTSVSSGVVGVSELLSGGSTLANTHLVVNNTGTGIGGAGTYLLDTTQTSNFSGTFTTAIQPVNMSYFPYFQCDPDDSTYPFKILIQAGNATLGYQTGPIGSSDLVNWTFLGSSTRPYSNLDIGRALSVARTGVNTWIAIGATRYNYSPPLGVFANVAGWSGTSAYLWTWNAVYSNSCLPANSPTGSSPCPAGSNGFIPYQLPDGLITTVGAQNYLLFKDELNLSASNYNQNGQQIALAPIDSNYNVLSSPAVIPISNLYCVPEGGNFISSGGCFPGPRYLDQVGGYQESGILNAYTVNGFFACLQAAGCTTQITYGQGGGLAQQLVDRYCYVINSGSAINASPTGFTASANAGVVTLSWDQCLAGVNYHLYYGYSPNTIVNLIGTVTGDSRSTTYSPFLQAPQVVYFKLVTLNGSTEEGSRVASTYVSSSSKLVNQHMTRVLADGADPATIDRPWLDTIQSFLSGQSLTGNLRYWGDASFGVAQNTSGVVSAMFDLGSTLRPVFGDWGFCTGSNPCTGSSSTYSPIAFNNEVPGITTPTGAYSFAGVTSGNRLNTLRRMVEITACSFYSKTTTALTTLLGYGGSDFGIVSMQLQHTAGTPGNASFTLADNATSATVTSAMSSNTGPHVICGTFSTAGSTSITSFGTLTVYADGVAGTPNTTSLHTNVDPTGVNTLQLTTTLSGSYGGAFGGHTLIPFLGTGSTNTKANIVNPSTTPGPIATPTYIYEQNESNFTEGATIVFDKALTATQIQTITNMYLNRVTPTVAKAYNIVTDFGATCNGVANDSAAFTSYNTAAVAWDAANPGVSGVIQLTIPNSSCMFLQAASSIAFNSGIINHKVRVVGAGSSSTLSDGGTGGGFYIGAGPLAGESFAGASQATVQTVSKGATSVTLTACPGAGCSAALALFTVGQWARVSGLALQSNGNPSNPAFWDYVLVSGKTATDVQFTTTPLTHNYESTWPSYGTAYYGGPATIYALGAAFPLTVEVNGLTISHTNTAGDGAAEVGMDITLKNVTISTADGNTCGDPSQNMFYRLIKVTATNCTYEVDKIVDNLIFQNSTFKTADYQSASVKQTIVSESSISSHINTGINTFIYGSTLASFNPGPHSFGGAYGLTVMENNIINAYVISGSSTSTIDTVGSWAGGIYTIANATIPSVSGSNASLTWAVPGANVYVGGAHGIQGPIFYVTDLTQDVTNTYVHTSLSGGFPVMPGSGLTAFSHNAPQYFGSGNTGSALPAVDFNPPATYQGLPLGSYWSAVITSANGNPSSPVDPWIWGTLVEEDWTITAACSGTSTFGFGGFTFVQTLGSSSFPTWNPTANAQVASATPRQLFPTTTAGAQSGDSLVAPGANTWLLSQQNQPSYSTVANCGSASTTVVYKTNQGVTPAP